MSNGQGERYSEAWLDKHESYENNEWNYFQISIGSYAH